MGQRINLHCCVDASETFYKGDKSDMKTLLNLVLSHFTKSGSNPLSAVGGNLGNEVLRKWMKTSSDHTFSISDLEIGIRYPRSKIVSLYSYNVYQKGLCDLNLVSHGRDLLHLIQLRISI